jgi:polyphosphate kinase 2 (PPK2 family)
MIILLEGMDTADERGQHYMQRFFSRLPQAGEICVFDRSWYGRVLVEKVEKFAKPSQWKRAYDEINQVEKMLMDVIETGKSGMIINWPINR